jgi:hypothetical protein
VASSEFSSHIDEATMSWLTASATSPAARTQVLEFVAFGRRLQRSHTHAVAAAEAALARLRGGVVAAGPSGALNAAQLAALSAVGIMAQHEADTGAAQVTPSPCGSAHPDTYGTIQAQGTLPLYISE